jgi:antitoxin (DNA-binding transcriptional repressor) of toxin-antitoxin stability system
MKRLQKRNRACWATDRSQISKSRICLKFDQRAHVMISKTSALRRERTNRELGERATACASGEAIFRIIGSRRAPIRELPGSSREWHVDREEPSNRVRKTLVTLGDQEGFERGRRGPRSCSRLGVALYPRQQRCLWAQMISRNLHRFHLSSKVPSSSVSV